MNNTRNLMEQLRNHDWYYAYSDDHRVWTRGEQENKRLRALLADFQCPYEMSKLRMAVHNMVVEDYVEEKPGRWFRQGNKYPNIAPTKRSELMHRADQVQIMAWIEAQDRKWNNV